ncbi:uncharacterized protein LOC125770594 [Anopheles funestus]|uniref:uncharacterized protein LOC125770594 n=1 Tax=Anopheles funestus TaxID=62324 RepID=UPI0020C63A0D|nr:uncharacterized protein LOC125770594 [Anopheles funestus]XP_049296332.1 uncharacterized protein LOC125770594 [Anopheles funestus]
MPSQFRHFFALILSPGMPQEPRKLWDMYAELLCEDFRFHDRDRYTSQQSDLNTLLIDVERFRALREIDRFLRRTIPAKDLTTFPDMPQLQDYEHVGEHLRNDANEVNEFITTERAYAVNDLDETLATLHLLNDEQRTVYDKITAAIDRVRISTSTTTDTDVNTNSTGIYNAEDNRFFFLDGPGGTGKSFVLEKVLAYTRRQSNIALATTASAIAALFLSGGRTVHSTFKLPLDLNRHSTCNIPVQSKRAELIRQATLIVRDEASMSSQ